MRLHTLAFTSVLLTLAACSAKVDNTESGGSAVPMQMLTPTPTPTPTRCRHRRRHGCRHGADTDADTMPTRMLTLMPMLRVHRPSPGRA